MVHYTPVDHGPGHICPVTEALNAYQSFCKLLPRRYNASSLGTARGLTAQSALDQLKFARWLANYKENYHNRWWEIMPLDELLAALDLLPLDCESAEELRECTVCIVGGP